MPSAPQMDALFRAILGIATGYLIKYGVDEASAGLIAGGLLAGLTVAWGYLVNRPKELIEAAGSQDEVKKIRVNNQDLADELGPKVVGPKQQ
jgi:hypothetical protein